MSHPVVPPVRDEDTRDLLISRLEMEILRAEHLRVSLLAIIGVVLALGGLFASTVFSGFFDRLFSGRLPIWPATLIIAAFVVYELGVRFAIGVVIKAKRRPPPAARYANAVIETSFPTLALAFVASNVHPAYALVSPLAYLYFIFIALSALRLDLRLSVVTGLVAAVGYLAVYFVAFADLPAAGMHEALVAFPPYLGRAVLYLLVAVVTGLVAQQIRQRAANAIALVDERNDVVAKFGQHVSPEVVNKLLDQKTELGSENRKVCVMFLDIRNFTTFCEGKTPEEVVSHLNYLFGFMVEVVNAHSGIINKFLGDGFMAVFGAPFSEGRDSHNAVRAAIEILEALEAERKAGRAGDTRVGIGLHTGEVMTGNIGSTRRKEYTVIGDTVNLASRIEGLNKQHASQLLISDEVRREIEGSELGAVDEIGPVQVKGRAEPVHVYKVA